jgi:type IV secretory pathway VirD2 relaxase
MRWSRLLLGEDEHGLRLPPLKAGQAGGSRRFRPWWIGALRRAKQATAIRRQSRTTAEGGGNRRPARLLKVYGRRCVVKVSYRGNRGNGAWVRHGRYLGREHGQREHEHGLGFDAVREDLDMARVVREWERAGDRRLWSLIVSPEDAAHLNLAEHARCLVREIERDIGTTLEWIGIDHHDTDEPHVHLLIRGVRDDGRTLTLDRDYVQRGIRERSRELIERELGPRTEQEVLLARERVIEREQWTEIDRALKQREGRDRVVSYEDFEPHSEGAQVRAAQEMERLKYLEKLGLARRIDEYSWELSPEHERELRRRQQEHDILKTRARERQRERGHDKGLELER